MIQMLVFVNRIFVVGIEREKNVNQIKHFKEKNLKKKKFLRQQNFEEKTNLTPNICLNKKNASLTVSTKENVLASPLKKLTMIFLQE